MDYAAMLPTQPPEGMTAFLHKNGYLKKEYIVYTASRQSTPDGVGKGVQCTCTACGETSISSHRAMGGRSHSYRRAPFGFEHPRFKQSIYDGDSTLCPVCGAAVEAIHIGNIYREGRMMECCYPVTIQNIDGYLCVIEYQAATILQKNGRFNLRYLPSEAAIIDKRKIVRCNGIRRYYYSYIDLGKWEQRVKYVDEIGKKNKSLIYPFEKNVLNGTYAENSKL